MLIGSVIASSPMVSPNAVQTVGLLHATGVCVDGSTQAKGAGVCT